MFDGAVVFFQQENINNCSEAIDFMARSLEKKKIVKNTFRKAVLDREKIYPTGLPLNGRGIAIPHADSIHVNRNQIAIMTLKKPILFQQMSDPSQSVDVNIIFMLAIKDPKAQLATLKALMSLVQESENVERIIKLENRSESIVFLKKILQENDVI